MPADRVERWLRRIAAISPADIELGLDRVARVHARLGGGRPGARVVTVAGTNGKGTCVHFLEGLLRGAGQRVALYTSPHLLRFNERMRLDGAPIGDEALCAAFERVEQARGAEPLTYFEFTTLAALSWFESCAPDVAVLEVGLGGRLDAVNVVDADVAAVTRIGLDHTDWLGDTLAAIGREKAGVFRRGRPAICADPAPPPTVREAAVAVGATPWFRGHEFEVDTGEAQFAVRSDDWGLAGLPRPSGSPVEGFVAALWAAKWLGMLPPRAAIDTQLRAWALPGRLQWVPGDPPFLLDVAHNPQAAQVLAAALEDRAGDSALHAVVGLLGDKDAAGFVAPLLPIVDHWHAVPLPGARGRGAAQLAAALRAAGARDVIAHDSVAGALGVARARALGRGCVAVCGSFQVVGPALAWLGIYSATHASGASEGA